MRTTITPAEATAINTTAASRRGILASLGGGVALAAVAAVPSAMAAASPDADLIRLCDAYMKAVAALNADRSGLEAEDDPLWWAVEDIEAQLEDMHAQTLAGVLAKARVAAFLSQQPDGSVNWSTSFTGDWLEQVALDLLRMAGGSREMLALQGAVA
jgi:hypothetical protein